MDSADIAATIRDFFEELEKNGARSSKAEKEAGLHLAILRRLELMARSGADLKDLRLFLIESIVRSGEVGSQTANMEGNNYWVAVNQELIAIQQYLEVIEMFVKNSIMPTIKKYFS